jgi:HEAT repeat protein
MRAFKARERNDAVALADPKLEAALIRLSEDEDALIRSETAYALGRLATPTSIERLAVMIGDPHADTRYNAAVALAHQGHAASVQMLSEMLEPVSLPSADEEPEGPGRVRKRATIVHNALEAAKALATKNPMADLSPIVHSLRALADSSDAALEEASIPREAISAAKQTLEVLPQRD